MLALAGELEQSSADIEQWSKHLFDTSATAESRQLALSAYLDFLNRFSNAVTAIGLPDVQALMKHIEENLHALQESQENNQFAELHQKLVCEWSRLFADFLKLPTDPDAVNGLDACLVSDLWQRNTQAEKLNGIIGIVQDFASSKDTEKSANQAQVDFTDEDVTITVPDDINPKLLQSFCVELPENTNDFSELIHKIHTGNASLDDIGRARKIAHTLKGAGNIVGVPGVANISYRLEAILEYFFNANGYPIDVIRKDLVDAADCLESISDAVLGQGKSPDNSLAILSRLNEWTLKLDQEGSDLIDSTLSANESTAEASAVGANLSVLGESQTVDTGVAEENDRVTPIDADTVDIMLEISSELLNSNLMLQAGLNNLKQSSAGLLQSQDNLKQTQQWLQDILVNQFDSELTISDTGLIEVDGVTSHPSIKNDELQSVASFLAEAAADISYLNQQSAMELTGLQGTLLQQESLIKDFARSILDKRLVNVGSLVPRLQRVVRQMCHSLDKHAELVVEGSTVSLDGAVLEKLIESLTHILRNAVDHGVETPADRVASGKPDTALIRLVFVREGNTITVSCKDDGKGIDQKAVKEKAIELKLINSYQILNKIELLELIMQPGFSTKRVADQTSGRGLGLDIVHKNITALRGKVSIKSEGSEGTEICITVPATMAKSHVTLLRAQQYTFGIISSSFDQLIEIEPGQLTHNRNEASIIANQNIYSVRYLQELLGLGCADDKQFTVKNSAVLSKVGDEYYAVVLNQILSAGDMFMKKVSRFAPQLNGLVGIVVTNEGRIAPVYDLHELLRNPSKLVENYLTQHVDKTRAQALSVLIVDDSSSARNSLSQVTRDAGFDVRTAIDGIEAISLIETSRPDILLTDLEMPKMNGLRLAAQLRSSESTKNLPIVMITSRSTEKHRQQAMATGVDCYITKPYSNIELINQINTLLATAVNH